MLKLKLYAFIWYCTSGTVAAVIAECSGIMDRLMSFLVGKTKQDLEKSKRQLEYDLDEINIKLKQR